jgi:hypothetical protein
LKSFVRPKRDATINL